jgi:putative peptide zinc metalloprotease protein
MQLHFRIDLAQLQVEYTLRQDDQVVLKDKVPAGPDNWHKPAEPPQPAAPNPGLARGHAVSILGLLFKLLKSVNVIKVVLAGSALAAWSILFSWQFAVVLIGVTVFHEYGHLRAMKKFGMKTKGMYLIPFVGGMAVGERAQSYWQEIYISMMGPVFGLCMALAFYLLFLGTGSQFVGLVASVSALLNLFNLLPVYPLDGGHVVKSLVLSGRGHWGFSLLLAMSAACFGTALAFGLHFLSFFIVIGVLDLLASRARFAANPQEPLSSYGIWFCVAWYLGVVAVFIGIILLMASSGVPGTEIATEVLKS